MTRRRSVVTENRAASVDGTKRTLVVVIEDASVNESASYLRKKTIGSGTYSGKEWTERFEAPGQCVRATAGGAGGATTRMFMATSPYRVREASANWDSAKVEFLVDGKRHPEALTGAKPGDAFRVSEPLGRGFSNVLFAERSLEAAMRKGHSLVVIACDTDGLASAASLFDWQPVLAYADAHPVTLFYLCESQESAALVASHDDWRAAGFKIIPCYGSLSDQIFMMEQCFLTGALAAGGKPTILGASADKCSALLAGAEGETASRILHLLTDRGLARDNILTPN